MFSTIDIYAHRRDPDYDYHTFDAKVEFAVESKCSVLELLGDDSCGHGTSRDGVEREGELSGDELGNWIAQTSKGKDATNGAATTGESAGGLQILFGVCGFDADSGNPMLPFTEKDWKSLERQFDIPPEFMPTLTGTTARAFRCPSRDLDRAGASITRYLFRFGIWRPGYYQMAVSYDPRTQLTFVMLVAKRPEHEFPAIIEAFKSEWRFARHPLLVPALVSRFVSCSIAQRIHIADRKLNELEEMLGQHEYTNRPIGNPLEVDFVATTRTLSFLARILGVEKMRASGQVLVMDLISTEAKSDACSAQLGNGFRTVLAMAGEQRDAAQRLVLRAEYEEKRVQTQVSVVFQFMAQKDSKVNISLAETSTIIAHESRKDGTAMKTIALLTMCFLPGTFLAALFAMPLFVWDEDVVRVKPSFKYYWAIAIPLTAGVLVIWALPWNKWYRKFKRYRHTHDLEAGTSRSQKVE